MIFDFFHLFITLGIFTFSSLGSHFKNEKEIIEKKGQFISDDSQGKDILNATNAESMTLYEPSILNDIKNRESKKKHCKSKSSKRQSDLLSKTDEAKSDEKYPKDMVPLSSHESTTIIINPETMTKLIDSSVSNDNSSNDTPIMVKKSKTSKSLILENIEHDPLLREIFTALSPIMPTDLIMITE